MDNGRVYYPLFFGQWKRPDNRVVAKRTKDPAAIVD